MVKHDIRTVAFNGDANIEIIHHSGEDWLRGDAICATLCYTNPQKAIKDIYRWHKDEFTKDTTRILTLPTEGGPQKVRVFNRRGAWMLGMFARTEKAKEFRHWVLHVLEEHTIRQEQSTPEDTTTFIRNQINMATIFARAMVKKQLQDLDIEGLCLPAILRELSAARCNTTQIRLMLEHADTGIDPLWKQEILRQVETLEAHQQQAQSAGEVPADVVCHAVETIETYAKKP